MVVVSTTDWLTSKRMTSDGPLRSVLSRLTEVPTASLEKSMITSARSAVASDEAQRLGSRGVCSGSRWSALVATALTVGGAGAAVGGGAAAVFR